MKIDLNAMRRNPNLAVPAYLIHSYLYYVHDAPVIADHDYDEVCRILLNNFDTITHNHKSYLDKDSLRAGTSYHIKADEYPQIVRSCAQGLVPGIDINHPIGYTYDEQGIATCLRSSDG